MNETQKLMPFQNMSESFTAFSDKNTYYVDKTDFIRYMIGSGHAICVVTRPRRFGKTLMLRMLQTFFEYALDDEGKPVDNRRYFEGLKVMEAGDAVLKEMGQYPVISLSLKGMRNDTLDDMVIKLRNALASACSKHEYLLDHPALKDFEHEQFRDILSERVEQANLEEALGNLCKWIYKATKRQTVILLDEYDVPLQKAAIHDIHHPGDNFFDKMVSLVGNFISSGFKSNDYLAYGIIAGCMRVAKESIFTGMNNPGVITVVDEIPNEYWGFTHEEVADMLAYYGISDKMDALKYWYDGYLYSGREVFNPWSLLNAIRGLVYGQGDKAIQSYWAMTSSNDIIDEMIDNNPEYRNELARLMRGETKWVPVYKDLLYRDLKLRPDAIWSFLLYTGYLKPIEIKKDEDDLLIAKVAVPNEEILTVMKSAMQHWWKDIKLLNFNSQTLLRALITGDVSNAEREIRIVLNDSTSVFDYNEAFYHGMLMGLLGNVAIVRSNDEYGEGRPDIVALAEETGVIIEVKCVTPKMLQQVKKSCPSMDEDDLVDELCEIQLDEARQQIVNRKYARAVLRHEPIARTVVAYAVCFCKKWCVMQKVDVE